MKILEQQADLFKSSLLTCGINAHKYLFNGQDGCKSIHNSVPDYAPKPFREQKKPHACTDGFAEIIVTSHQSFRRLMVMILQAIFVTNNLTIKLVDQFIHRSIQISMSTFGKNIIAFDMDIAFRSLPTFLFPLIFYREKHFDINYLIKMSNDPIQFTRYISTQGWRDLKVMTTDRQIHK
jgi:hypothetical protein